MKTTDSKGSVGILIRRLINTTTKERLTVFCAEHFVDSTTGEIENATHIKPTDPKMKQACKVAYFGWYNKYPDYVVDGGILAGDMKWVKQDYVFTQQMIWEVLGQSSARFIDSSIQSQYEAFKSGINQQMSNAKKSQALVMLQQLLKQVKVQLLQIQTEYLQTILLWIKQLMELDFNITREKIQ